MMQRIRRLWFGEDFFISYARADGAAYAAALANQLGARDFSCFLDQWQPTAGHEIPPSIIRHLGRASTLVVVGSPHAADSPSVAKDVNAFLARNRPVVPIAFGVALPLGDALRPLAGIAWSSEQLSALEDGVPSDGVVRRLTNTFEYRRRNQRIRWSLGAFTTASLLLAAASGWFALEARQRGAELTTSNVKLETTITELTAQTGIAQQNLARYEAEAAESKRLADSAETRRLRAERALSARDSAQRARDVATRAFDRSLDLAQNRTVTLDFNRSEIDPRSISVLRGLFTLIRETEYAGRIDLDSHVGRFCVSLDREGAPDREAPAGVPIGDCTFWPSARYAEKLSIDFGDRVKGVAASVGLRPDSIRVRAFGDRTPRQPYPTSGTAREWNAAALRNNRIEFRLRP